MAKGKRDMRAWIIDIIESPQPCARHSFAFDYIPALEGYLALRSTGHGITPRLIAYPSR